jgi:hypothetical protein
MKIKKNWKRQSQHSAGGTTKWKVMMRNWKNRNWMWMEGMWMSRSQKKKREEGRAAVY